MPDALLPGPPPGPPPGPRAGRRRPSPAQVGLLVGIFVALPCLSVPWVMDDWFILLIGRAWSGEAGLPFSGWLSAQVDPLGLPQPFCFAHGDSARTAALAAEGLYPWWVEPSLRLCFWRPLAAASHQLDQALSPGGAGLAHLHSLLWYALACAGVGAFWARRLPPAVARLAALVYALDEAHAFPVAWVANRNGLMAAAFAAGALVAADRGRPLLAAAACAFALMSGEAGLGAVALVLALGLVDGRPRAALPAVAVGIGWLGLYAGLGFGAAGSGLYTDPRDLLAWAGEALVHLPILLGVFLGPVSADVLMADPSLRPLVLAPALGVTGAVAWGLRRAWPALEADRRQAVIFGALGLTLALLPAASTTPTSRLVTLPGAAGAGLLAVLLAQAWRARAAEPRDRRLLGLGAVLGVAHLALPLAVWAGVPWALRQGDATARALIPGVEAAARGADAAVLLIGSDPALSLYLPFGAAALGSPAPSWRTLSPAPVPHRLRRTAEDALEIEPLGEPMLRRPFARLYRGGPMPAGATVDAGLLQVEVLADEGGAPTRIRARFDRPLDDPGLALLLWDGAALVRWAPPPVGESVELAWYPGPTRM